MILYSIFVNVWIVSLATHWLRVLFCIFVFELEFLQHYWFYCISRFFKAKYEVVIAKCTSFLPSIFGNVQNLETFWRDFAKHCIAMKWGYGQAWPFELWSEWKSIWFGLCRPALDQLWGKTPFALSEVSSALWQAPINQPERKNDDRSSEKSVEPHWLRHKRIVFFLLSVHSI